MVYEPDQHDDAVTPDNIVRSQFGSPRSGANGATGHRDTSSDVPETYRFDPHRPRRRRYADDDGTQAPQAQAATDGPGASNEPPTSGWTVARPTFGKGQKGSGGMPRRPSRAERRRAAEGDTAEQPATPGRAARRPACCATAGHRRHGQRARRHRAAVRHRPQVRPASDSVVSAQHPGQRHHRTNRSLPPPKSAPRNCRPSRRHRRARTCSRWRRRRRPSPTRRTRESWKRFATFPVSPAHGSPTRIENSRWTSPTTPTARSSSGRFRNCSTVDWACECNRSARRWGRSKPATRASVCHP